jgi:hypothetical protein
VIACYKRQKNKELSKLNKQINKLKEMNKPIFSSSRHVPAALAAPVLVPEVEALVAATSAWPGTGLVTAAEFA